VVVLNGENRKTKVIKRGGQHPEWDEEIRFTIYEDVEALSPSDNGTPPPLPPKAGRGPKKIQGGEKMALACFAADKDPELIGETMVDLTEVLTKGETDGTSSTLSANICMLTLSLRMVHATQQR
jgi:neural Wiskott-Aldrich syndrome protein